MQVTKLNSAMPSLVLKDENQMSEIVLFFYLQHVINQLDFNADLSIESLLIEARFHLCTNNVISCSVVTQDWSTAQDAIDITKRHRWGGVLSVLFIILYFMLKRQLPHIIKSSYYDCVVQISSFHILPQRLLHH